MYFVKLLKSNDYENKTFILVMLLMPILFGCSEETRIKKELIGKWYNSCYGYYPSLGVRKNTYYDKIDTPEFLIFKENGTYEHVYRSSKAPENGEWTLDYSTITFFKKDEKGFITSQETAHIYKGVISISYGDNYVREYQKY